MNEYINFSNSKQNDDNCIISSNKNRNLNALMAFSLKNISTTYNSYTSNDFPSFRKNELRQNVELNNVIKLKNNEIEYKKSNNYYKKKDYSKYLNLPQSNNSTFCDTKNKLYSRCQINKGKLIPNLNSNFKENKIYNKLSINELIEITQKRKKLIKEKTLLEQLKKSKILQEEQKLMNLIIIDDKNYYSNNNLKCEEGVQTSLIISKDKKNENKNNSNFQLNNKNTIENDLVNIGNEIGKNSNNNSDLIFNIEINEDNIPKEKKDKFDDSSEKNNINNYSNYSSNNENETSRIEEYDINKENLKNETKSDIQDYINDSEKNIQKEKISIKLNKSKSVKSIGINRYENIDINNQDNFELYESKLYNNRNEINNDDIKLSQIFNKKININSLLCNNNNTNKEIQLNRNKIKYSFSIRNINKNKNLKINLSQNNGLNHNDKAQIFSQKENKMKKKRQIDNYSYYFKLKEKSKNKNFKY